MKPFSSKSSQSKENHNPEYSSSPKRRKGKRRERKNEVSEDEAHFQRHKKSLSKLKEQKPKKVPDEDDINALTREVNEKDYQIVTLLGVGSQGRVYLVRLTETNQHFAMKVFRKDRILPNAKTTRSILTEHRFLAQTDHPFITKLFHSFHSLERLYMVMEFCPGGELFTTIKKQPEARLNEDQVRFYASEVVLVLEYVHSRGYIYRDLKPENILLHLDGHIRVADFGLSKQSETLPQIQLFERKSKSRNPFSRKKCVLDLQQGEVLRTNSLVGSIHYLAPEVVSGQDYDVLADWWAFGVLLYDLFYGYPPFRGHSNKEIIMAISQCDYQFSETVPIGNPLKSLIKGLLRLDPKKRICAKHGASDVKRHPFFAGLNWGLLRNRVPPIIPEVTSESDTSHFEVYEEDEDSIDFQFFSELPQEVQISEEDQQKFAEFFYVSNPYSQTLLERHALTHPKPSKPKRKRRKRSQRSQIPKSRPRASTIDSGACFPLPPAENFDFEAHLNNLMNSNDPARLNGKFEFGEKRAKKKPVRKQSATHTHNDDIPSENSFD